MWKLTAEAENWEPLPGVPKRDMSDEEFRAEAKAYSERNGGADHGHGPRSLHNSGFWEHVEDAKKAPSDSAPAAEGDK